MSRFEGRVAVVTGAGSGIGRELALALSRRGALLAISDVDEAGLAGTVELLGPVVVDARPLDVTDRAAVLAYADDVAGTYGKVNQVYNNAGIAHAGDVLTATFEEIERVVDVDFWGVVNGTKAFLPHLIASGDGHLVNLSSLFGLLSAPGASAYNAAKFAVRGFTESLRQEMLIAGHPVRVTCVHPGGVKTGIARNATLGSGHDAGSTERFDANLLRLPPEAAAAQILAGVRRNRPRVLVGNDARLLDLVVRVVGARYQRPMAVLSRRSMR